MSLTANAIESPLAQFTDLYNESLSNAKSCGNRAHRVCSDALRNDGNGPYILHHNTKTEAVVVLFHGLSDSPFYFSAIAPLLHERGMNVVVPLLPGHGLKNAHDIMQSSELSDKWRHHVSQVMMFAKEFGNKVYIGGFSTGGALATQYVLENPADVSGLLLFSGALALSDNAESLSRIWGVGMLARLLDGEYMTDGPNPYKYPSVSNSSGIELMEVISDIRSQLDEGKRLNLPIFAAHSESDITTPIRGVENLLTFNDGTNTALYINAKYKVCHGNLMLDKAAVRKIGIKKSSLDAREPCALPQANPVFTQVANLLTTYFALQE
ncbi:alpha/beta fold hydrolase [Alteromonas sediminis]|uniref:Alpha/beta fold hydrolase n=1 Tax=Alteromonas sediminis TaxID=2259342 RepID=A0A3N5Y4A6_9ALTE|nr:alpha/beta fold hydrolase [Alteromonas sediminis]RPJ67933.1 alpha/beta fold hydrolase [Alteromonas sediminis]